MELLQISDSKLKVMLSGEDLASFDLRAEDLDYSNTETKRMFWDILNRAKQTIGFNTDGARVLVQLYPSRSGECEIFITKLGSICRTCGESVGTDEIPLQPLLHYKPLHHSPHGKGKTGAFGFEQMEWMILVCRRLCGIGYSGESEAYIGDNGRYYLFLDGLDPDGYIPLDEYSFIVEYGSSENVEALRGFLGEHGRAICEENAVERLGIL